MAETNGEKMAETKQDKIDRWYALWKDENIDWDDLNKYCIEREQKGWERCDGCGCIGWPGNNTECGTIVCEKLNAQCTE